MSPTSVDVLWTVLKDIVWESSSTTEAEAQDQEFYWMHGHLCGITKFTLYPPTKKCTNPLCNASSNGTLLKKEEQRRVVVFTLACGPQPAWLIDHYLFSLISLPYQLPPDGVRTYYNTIPSYIQVAEHQFVEHALAMHWMDLLQIAVSATNCARLYEIAFARRNQRDIPSDWQFGTSLTTEEVWDAFTIWLCWTTIDNATIGCRFLIVAIKKTALPKQCVHALSGLLLMVMRSYHMLVTDAFACFQVLMAHSGRQKWS
ncbi:hypothetical protein JVT61DRAFT_4251 [Boletus reticuloceps]|uniref:CxC5 like cysteine cluster associated with KDZ domain-containing protein n=1 Tax=Boletus reticuloceps TaxID=495285 RepID=A0A8I3A965_9AGAM|nr:hypothetical protein JVT61DRAFT_4251 [Boletus reticuloceps]